MSGNLCTFVEIVIVQYDLMLNKKYKTLMACALAALIGGCSHQQTEQRLVLLSQDASRRMASVDMSGLDSVATLLLSEARAASNKKYEGKALFYLSYIEPGVSESEAKLRMQNLKQAEQIARDIEDNQLLCQVFNQYGVWEIQYLENLNTAQLWFTRSIEVAAGLDERRYSIPAEVNLSETFRLTGDSIGIHYDLALYDYAKANNDSLLEFSAALHCANYYAPIVADTADLRPYIESMRHLEYNFPGLPDIIYARHFYYRGDYDKAEECMLKSDPMKYGDFALLYANILQKQSKYHQAEAVLDTLSSQLPLLAFDQMGPYMRLRAENASSLGKYDQAYQYMEQLQAFRDSMDQAKSLDITRRYRTEYEVFAKDKEISEQKMHIRTLWISISSIVLLIMGSVVGLCLWLKKRNRLYRDIVRQNREFILRQTSQNISEDKAAAIYAKIRHYVDDEQVWRNPNITRETFAEMVGCNRTYFTEVLKLKSGQSYSQFMNSCRIQEAVRLLSFPNCDVSMKDLASQLGFLSVQSFYTAFKQTTGMSPAAYRDTAAKID